MTANMAGEYNFDIWMGPAHVRTMTLKKMMAYLNINIEQLGASAYPHWTWQGPEDSAACQTTSSQTSRALARASPQRMLYNEEIAGKSA